MRIAESCCACNDNICMMLDVVNKFIERNKLYVKNNDMGGPSNTLLTQGT